MSKSELSCLRPVSTPEDRAERLKQLSHKFGKSHKQIRSNERRRAIRESREAA